MNLEYFSIYLDPEKPGVYLGCSSLNTGHCIMTQIMSNTRILPVKRCTASMKMVPTWTCLRTPNDELDGSEVPHKQLSYSQQSTACN